MLEEKVHHFKMKKNNSVKQKQDTSGGQGQSNIAFRKNM